MKIALAQIKSNKDDLEENIQKHLQYIKKAIQQQADLIAFPELSLTAYEPSLAKKSAIFPQEERLKIFQQLSNKGNISIALGVATTNEADAIFISMLLFQLQQPLQIYNKRYLHTDELPYFQAGNQAVFFNIKNQRIAPAICYESLRIEHAKEAAEQGSHIYLASVAKPARGLEKAFVHYPKIAKQYQMTVLMVNNIGYCDNFESAGQSAAWNKEGQLIAQLGKAEEDLLLVEVTKSMLIDKIFVSK
ncbi:MAG: carbon-nitrogen hydrolase family protein [Bacteroidota bacterium]